MNPVEQPIIIDGFYSNPDAVRALALSLEYENLSTPNYPGFQSTRPCVSSSAIHALERAIGGPIDLDRSRSQLGFFRYITKSGKSRLHVHTDLTDWSAVVYLSPTSSPGSGTTFYRHRRTALIGPPSSDQMARMGFTDFSDYERQVVLPDTLDPAAWDVTTEIENLYNRCVIFRSSKLFHSHGGAFGSSLTDARLTQNFFIRTPRNGVHP